MSRYVYAIVCGTKGCLWSDPAAVGHYGLDTLADARAELRADNRDGCLICDGREHRIFRALKERVWEEVR